MNAQQYTTLEEVSQAIRHKTDEMQELIEQLTKNLTVGSDVDKNSTELDSIELLKKVHQLDAVVASKNNAITELEEQVKYLTKELTVKSADNIKLKAENSKLRSELRAMNLELEDVCERMHHMKPIVMTDEEFY